MKGRRRILAAVATVAGALDAAGIVAALAADVPGGLAAIAVDREAEAAPVAVDPALADMEDPGAPTSAGINAGREDTEAPVQEDRAAVDFAAALAGTTVDRARSIATSMGIKARARRRNPGNRW